MARRRNGFIQLAEKLESVFLAPFILGVAQSAQAVVKDLQDELPSNPGGALENPLLDQAFVKLCAVTCCTSVPVF
jgi:hypothetical protein